MLRLDRCLESLRRVVARLLHSSKVYVNSSASIAGEKDAAVRKVGGRPPAEPVRAVGPSAAVQKSPLWVRVHNGPIVAAARPCQARGTALDGNSLENLYRSDA